MAQTFNSLVPLQIGIENNWQMIDGGSVHTVALKTDETLWTWGSNSVGQLGDESHLLIKMSRHY